LSTTVAVALFLIMKERCGNTTALPDKTASQVLLYTNYYKALLGPQNFRHSVVLSADKVTSCEYMIIQSNLDWSLQTAPH